MKTSSQTKKVFRYTFKRLWADKAVSITIFVLLIAVSVIILFGLDYLAKSNNPYVRDDIAEEELVRQYTTECNVNKALAAYYNAEITIDELFAECKRLGSPIGSVEITNVEFWKSKAIRDSQRYEHYLQQLSDGSFVQSRLSEEDLEGWSSRCAAACSMLETSEAAFAIALVAALIFLAATAWRNTGVNVKNLLCAANRSAVFNGGNAAVYVLTLGYYFAACLVALCFGAQNYDAVMEFYLYGGYREINCVALLACQFVGGALCLSALIAIAQALYAKTHGKFWSLLAPLAYLIPAVCLVYFRDLPAEPYKEYFPLVSPAYSITGYMGIMNWVYLVMNVTAITLCTRYARNRFVAADIETS